MKKIIHAKRFIMECTLPTDPVELAEFIVKTAKQLGSTFVYVDSEYEYGDVTNGISFDYEAGETDMEYELRIQREAAAEAEERATYERLRAKFEPCLANMWSSN